MFIKHTDESLREHKIAEVFHKRFMDILVQTRSLIVCEEENQFTLWENLNYRNKFEPLVTSFVEKLAKDPLFSSYFEANIMMKHMMCSCFCPVSKPDQITSRM